MRVTGQGKYVLKLPRVIRRRFSGSPRGPISAPPLMCCVFRRAALAGLEGGQGSRRAGNDDDAANNSWPRDGQRRSHDLSVPGRVKDFFRQGALQVVTK